MKEVGYEQWPLLGETDFRFERPGSCLRYVWLKERH